MSDESVGEKKHHKRKFLGIFRKKNDGSTQQISPEELQALNKIRDEFSASDSVREKFEDAVNDENSPNWQTPSVDDNDLLLAEKKQEATVENTVSSPSDESDDGSFYKDAVAEVKEEAKQTNDTELLTALNKMDESNVSPSKKEIPSVDESVDVYPEDKDIEDALSSLEKKEKSAHKYHGGSKESEDVYEDLVEAEVETDILKRAVKKNKKNNSSSKKKSKSEEIPALSVQKAEKTVNTMLEEVVDLQDRVDEFKAKVTSRGDAFSLFLDGGDEVITLKDFVHFLKQVSEEEFDVYRDDYSLSTWIKQKFDDDDLAFEISQTDSKYGAIKLVIEVINPQISSSILEPPKQTKPHKEVEEHFTKLNADHQEAMDNLKNVVKGSEDNASFDNLKLNLKLENDKLISTLNELVHALEIIDEKTYQKIPKDDKAKMGAWVKELAEKASHSQKIKPLSLQRNLLSLIDKYAKTLEKRIARERKALDVRAKELSTSENDIVKQHKELSKKEEQIKKYIDNYDSLNKDWEKKVADDNKTLEKQKKAALKEIDDQMKQLDESLTALKDTHVLVTKKHEEHLQSKDEFKKTQLDWMVEKKKTEHDFVKKEQELKKRENDLLKKQKSFSEKEQELLKEKESFEKNKKKQEDVIQESVDQVLKLKKGVAHEREKLELLREEINDSSFDSYVKKSLSSVETSHSAFHAENTKALEDSKIMHSDMYDRIDECNDAIEKNDFEKAKKVYNELKRMYDQDPLKSAEKDVLYDAIRELYANLHIAILDNQM